MTLLYRCATADSGIRNGLVNQHVHQLAGLHRDRGPGVLGPAQALLRHDTPLLSNARDHRDAPLSLRQLCLEHLLASPQAADKDGGPHQAPDMVIDLTRQSVGALSHP